MRTIRKEKAKIKPAIVSRLARPADVVAIGENSVDLVAVVPEWPAPDAKLALDALHVLPGGQVATAALAAARLGARARYLGCVGDDHWASRVRAALAESGLESRIVERSGARTRTAVVLVDSTGRRTILADRDPRLALTPDDVDPDWIRGGRLLMIDATEPDAALHAAAIARDAGMPVMLDVDRPGPAAEALLAVADVIITSAAFPETHTGESSLTAALAQIQARYRPWLVVATQGADGAVGLVDGRRFSVPAPRVEVVDTTGAGDAFRGAFAASWLAAGDEADPAELLRRAAVAGALNCRAVGARSALSDLAEIERWL